MKDNKDRCFLQVRTLLEKKNVNAKLDIVIRTLNELDNLKRLFQRIQNEPNVDEINIIVLDSGSQDGTLEFLLNQKNTSVYSIEKEKFNYGTSLDFLFSKCMSRYIFSFSAHIYWDSSGFLKKAISLLEENKCVAGYFRQIQNPHTGASILEKIFLKKRFPPKNRLISSTDTFHSMSFSNAGAVYKRDAWENLKFGDVDGSEDKIWAFKKLQQKERIGYFGILEIHHSHLENDAQMQKRFYLNAKQQMIFTGKTRSPLFIFCKYCIGILLYFPNKPKDAYKIAYNAYKANKDAEDDYLAHK